MGRSRGQVVLVAALGIAVTLLALGVIANAAVFTEQLATRETPTGADAIAFQHAASDGVGGLLALANRYNASSRSEIESQFRADVADLRSATIDQSVRYAELATVSVRSTTDGTRILQNETRALTNVSGAGNWTLATDVSGVRRFVMNVSQDSLGGDRPVTVIVDSKGATWRMTIAPDGGNARVQTSAGVECTVSGPSVVVDLSEGHVAGTECTDLLVATGVSSPYEVRIRNGTSARGRYLLFARSASVPATNYATDPANGPIAAPAIYSATVHVRVVGPSITYATNVTVAPEDAPDGAGYGVV
ncbi:MAG: hypothetical protein ABEJ77_06050 [Halanaeroarchaeum sp.]